MTDPSPVPPPSVSLPDMAPRLAVALVLVGAVAVGAATALLLLLVLRAPSGTWDPAPSFPTGPPLSPGQGEGPLRR